ncbi:MAG: hypothetical protein AAGA68_23700 [Pseudomonadota bacterium]
MPRKKTTTQDKLAAAGARVAARPAGAQADEMMRALALHASSQEACALIAEQAGHTYDAAHGHTIVQLRLECEEVNGRYADSLARQKALEAKCANTTQFIKSATAHLTAGISSAPGNDATAAEGTDAGALTPAPKPVRFRKWRFQDQISFCLILPGLAAALGMGAVNVYANLMASGQPVFIEQPWLAAFLSGLLPAGSTALKFVSGFFEYSRTKKRYALVVYILTGVALLAWCITFAMNFSGVSGGIDWDTLGKSNGKGSLLVGLQLTAELLAATALFLAAEDIALRYAPDSYVESPDFINATRVLRAHRTGHEALAARRSDLQGRLKAEEAKRDAAINDRVAAFLSYRARMQQSA